MPNRFAMETPLTDYKLERWIALFLFLLFFVPFVTVAQPAPLALVCTDDAAFLQHARGTAGGFVLNDARLVAGVVTKAVCSELPEPTPLQVSFNGMQSTLDYRCGESDDAGLVECVLELDGQPLAKRVAFEDETLKVLVSFAGDLDRDGRLDLLVDVARNRFDYRPALFLSSPSPSGVLKVAELSHSSRNNP
ncbi:MAG TPA: hypothetical protein VGF28_08145 [Thermoanaerobaculia bacterium]